MKILVNTRLLIRGKLDGIGWFSFETLKRITRNHPEHEFVFVFDRPYDLSFVFNDNVRPIVVGPKARHPFLYYLWFEYSLKRVLKKENPDLFFSPDGFLSLGSDTRQVAAFHDLNFEHHPEWLPWLSGSYYRYFFPRFAKKASRIITVSEYTKKDIVQTYGVSPDLIDVVYNGVSDHFRPLDYEAKSEAELKYSGGNPYFLFVGTLHPRKNIARLLIAYDAFRKTSAEKILLVLAGKKYWWTSEMEHVRSNMTYQGDVVFTGPLDEKEISLLTASARAMLYASCFEGFGIPIIEAMQSGTPVITSNITSMPEIAGEAALFVDPYSTDSIRQAMERISSDIQLRESLIQKGLDRSREYSWDRTAALLWASMQRVLQL